jgi:hypothetical protein
MFMMTEKLCDGIQDREIITNQLYYGKKNSGALVRQRTIPSERPPLVGEVSANFNG